MASIKKRPDGRWRARYRDPAGKEHARHFDRKVDAERWAAGIEMSKARGEWIDPRLGLVMFAEWADRWAATVVDLRPSTVERNLGIIRNHLVPRFGPVPVAKITASDVKAFVAESVGSGRHAPGSVRKAGQVMAKVMTAAVSEGMISRSPCDGVKLPAEADREMVFLTMGQVAELIEAHDPYDQVLVATAAHLGLRWGELAGLRTERVDLLRRSVAVVEQLTEVNGRLSIGPPKTAAGRRSVAVPAFLADLLASQLEQRAEPGGLVFPAREGGPMRRSNFRRRSWAPAARRAGIEGLRFHDLRHTAVALAIAQGAHPKAIQSRMGHSSIVTTLDRYGHLFPALDEQIAEGLDTAWREALADSARTGRGPAVAELPEVRAASGL